MTVTKEKSGTYTVQCWYRNWVGERHKKTKRGFRTKSEAAKWERNFLLAASGSPNMTFRDYYVLYRDDRRPQLKESTWRSKCYIIEDKLLPFFGDKQLDEITPTDVMRWQTELLNHEDPKTGKRFSSTYLRTVSNQLSAMFNHAVRYYNLRENPMKKVERMGSSKPPEMLFWTQDEYLKFADEVMDKPVSAAIFDLLYWCGIREGEALALTPADFDFDKEQLSITKSYQRIGSKDVVTSPKTPKSVRVIALPDFLAKEISDYIRFEGIAPDERLFKVTKHYLKHEMLRGSSAAHVKCIRVHDLRHSHVSLLIEMGFSVLAIADRMGHESVDITYRYAHLFPSAQTEMAQALNARRGGR